MLIIPLSYIIFALFVGLTIGYICFEYPEWKRDRKLAKQAKIDQKDNQAMDIANY